MNQVSFNISLVIILGTVSLLFFYFLEGLCYPSSHSIDTTVFPCCVILVCTPHQTLCMWGLPATEWAQHVETLPTGSPGFLWGVCEGSAVSRRPDFVFSQEGWSQCVPAAEKDYPSYFKPLALPTSPRGHGPLSGHLLGDFQTSWWTVSISRTVFSPEVGSPRPGNRNSLHTNPRGTFTVVFWGNVVDFVSMFCILVV